MLLFLGELFLKKLHYWREPDRQLYQPDGTNEWISVSACDILAKGTNAHLASASRSKIKRKVFQQQREQKTYWKPKQAMSKPKTKFYSVLYVFPNKNIKRNCLPAYAVSFQNMWYFETAGGF